MIHTRESLIAFRDHQRSTEEWRSVVGFEGLYEVSNCGRIKTIAARHASLRGSILKLDGKRYFRVCLTRNGIHRKHFIHRLVAAAFIGPLPCGNQVHHVDRNPLNNCSDNLKYLTAHENLSLPAETNRKKPKPIQGEPIRCHATFETEKWMPVVGYEDRYEVSSAGRVRRIRKLHYHEAGGLLRPVLSRNGYMRVGLARNSRSKLVKLSGIVASAFIGSRPAGWFVNHIDANKTNDRIENLEYVTPSGNVRHAMRMGLMTGIFKKGHAYHPRREKCAQK